MTPLIAELHRWSARPHRWGEFDCITTLADWVWRWHGVDPAAYVRQTYESAAEAQRLYGFLREPLAAMALRLDPILSRTDDHRAGDVGLAEYVDKGIPKAAPALKIGENWAFKTGDDAPMGVQIWVPRKVFAAWRVKYPG